MSRDRLWLALAVLLPAFAATIAPLPTGDLAYQLRAGELMLASGTVLSVDPFTFTAFGEPWLNQQWGTGVAVALVHGVAGWGGLSLLRAALITLVAGLVLVGCRAGLDRRPAAYLTLAGFLLGIGSLALRAQLFGIVCFVAVVAILAVREERPRALWLLPLVVLVWANLHGSFFLAPLVIGLAAVDDVVCRRPGRRTMLVVMVASAVATCLTPFGPEVWRYAVGLSTNATIARLISEWQRTSPLSVLGVLYYGSVLVAAFVVVRARRRGRTTEPGRALWLLALAALGAYAERGVVWWALAAPVALAPLVAAAFPRRERPARVEPQGLRRLNVVVAAGILVAAIVLQPLWRPGDSLTGPAGALRDAPGGLARVLAAMADSTDRVVVPQPWASWFEWSAPGRLVMVDSRIELFDEATWNDYLAIAGGKPAALEALDRTGATVVVVDLEEQPALGITLRAPDGGWRLAYEDEDGAIFTRVD
ncbi:MAG: hypothetical protein ABIG85_06555 [Chloroflexota bacterium]